MGVYKRYFSMDADNRPAMSMGSEASTNGINVSLAANDIAGIPDYADAVRSWVNKIVDLLRHTMSDQIDAWIGALTWI